MPEVVYIAAAGRGLYPRRLGRGAEGGREGMGKHWLPGAFRSGMEDAAQSAWIRSLAQVLERDEHASSVRGRGEEIARSALEVRRSRPAGRSRQTPYPVSVSFLTLSTHVVVLFFFILSV